MRISRPKALPVTRTFSFGTRQSSNSNCAWSSPAMLWSLRRIEKPGVSFSTISDPQMLRNHSAKTGSVAAFDGLTDQERGLLLAGEVGRLYALGAHSFRLG